MKKFIVEKNFNEKQLNTFLFDKLPTLSSNLFYKTLRKKDIKINGIRVSKNVTLNTDDEVLVYIADDLLNFSSNVFFEDDNIIIFDKPYNLEVTGQNSLTTLVHNQYKNLPFKPMPCHRIDRNTTGLVLFAKNQDSLSILLEKFKNHEINKHYFALVYGIPKEKSKKMEAYLFKDTKKSYVYISDYFKKGYQKIVTSYKILETYSNNTCLLDIQIETRKNTSNTCSSCSYRISYYWRSVNMVLMKLIKSLEKNIKCYVVIA